MGRLSVLPTVPVFTAAIRVQFTRRLAAPVAWNRAAAGARRSARASPAGSGLRRLLRLHRLEDGIPAHGKEFIGQG